MNLSDFSGSAAVKSLAGGGGEYPPLRPKILSVSRTTDIPAFYPEWFISRLNAGYSVKVNPITEGGAG